MAWEVEATDEFTRWYTQLSFGETRSVSRAVSMLELEGPQLRFPYSSGIIGSRYGHMRELRTQHGGKALRVLYAFDPRRTAILLLGGDKTGDDRWYDVMVPLADRLYDEYLDELRGEGLL